MAFTLQIGDTAPDFHLKSTTGKFYKLDEFKEDTLVLFLPVIIVLTLQVLMSILE